MKKQVTKMTLGALLLGGSIATANQKVSIAREQFYLATLSSSEHQVNNLFQNKVLILDTMGNVTIDIHKLQMYSKNNNSVDATSLVAILQELLDDQTAVRFVGPDEMRLSSQDRMGNGGGK